MDVDVIEVASCEAAELVKLANNQWIDLNIALANELAILCDSLPYDLDVLEVIQGANSLKGAALRKYIDSIDWRWWLLFDKGPLVRVCPGEKHGASIALPRCGREVNDKMPRYCANEIMSFFAGQGKSASDVKVAILGYSFKSNSGDVRFTPMEAFISHMLDEGVGNISVFDSTISDVAINDSRVRRVDRWEVCVDEADCVVFGAAHDDLCQIQISEFPNEWRTTAL